MATKPISGNVRTIRFYHRGEPHLARVGFYKHNKKDDFIRVDGLTPRAPNYGGEELIGVGADSVPRADGSGAYAEELAAMSPSNLVSGSWVYVPRSKVPANWRRWFDAHPAPPRGLVSRANGAKRPTTGFYRRKNDSYEGGYDYIKVEDIVDGAVYGFGTYTAYAPSKDGSWGPKAADFDLTLSDLRTYTKVPESKVPRHWLNWFKAHTRSNGHSSMTRRNPEVECREPKSKFDRYRSAKVWDGEKWIQIEGCHTGARYVGRAEGAKKRTTISKKVVRQKASRTPSRVKGVRARPMPQEQRARLSSIAKKRVKSRKAKK